MQRRAAAAYVAFFLVLAAGAVGMISLTDAPHAEVTSSEAEVVSPQGTSFTVGSGAAQQTYTVSDVSTGSGGGGHGGGGGSKEATLEWVNESEVLTHQWVVNETFEGPRSGTTYRVVDRPGENEFQFRPAPDETLNPRFESGVLVVDVDIDGDGYVEQGAPWGRYVGQNDSLSNVSVDADASTFDGSTSFEGNETTLTYDADANVLVAQWRDDVTHETTVTEGSTVTLAGTEYLAHIPNDRAVLLDRNDSTRYYERKQEARDHNRRMNGFWGVAMLSGFAAILVVGLAYMPRRS